jgi:hypothetical protein
MIFAELPSSRPKPSRKLALDPSELCVRKPPEVEELAPMG